jgi:hypothetical protein
MGSPYDIQFTMIYVVIDDWNQAEGAVVVRVRPGIKLRVSDSGVLALAHVRTLERQAREGRRYGTMSAN